jgi:hypothetical protein
MKLSIPSLEVKVLSFNNFYTSSDFSGLDISPAAFHRFIYVAAIFYATCVEIPPPEATSTKLL